MERAPPHAVLLLGVSLGAALSLSLPRALRALASVQDTLLGRNDGAVGSENELGTLPAAFFLGGLLGCTLTFSIWRSIGDREATVVAAAAQAAASASAAAAAAAARSAEKGSQSYSPSRTDGSPGRNGHGHSNGNGIGNGNGSGKVEVTDALHTRVAHLQMRGRAKGKVPRKLGKSFGTICSLGGSPQRIKGRKGGKGEVLGGPGKRSGKGGPDVFVGDAHSDLRNGGETGDAAFAAACAAAASTPASSAATTTMTTSTAVAATAFGTAAADAAAGRAAKPEDRLEPFTATEAADASSQSSSAVQQYKSAAAAAAGVYRIVLTGGPCGGKSSSVRHLIEALTTLGFDVLSPPEVPTLLLNGGCEYPGGGSGGSGGGEGLEATAAAATMLSTATAKAATTSSSSSNNNKMSSSSTVSSSSLSASAEAPTPTTASTPDDPLVRFEVALFRLQRQMEDSFYACARNTGRPTVIIFDRGLMDISAYCSAEQWATILRTEGCEADAMDRPSIYSPPLRSLSRWKGHRDRHWQRERQRQQLQRERERERKRRRERRRHRRRRRKKKGNGGISSTSSSSAAAAEAASASSSTSASAAAAVAVAIDGEDVVGAAATAAQEETASASQPEPKTPRAPASEMEGHALSAARASAIASRLGGLGFMDTLLHSPGTAPGNASLRPLALLEAKLLERYDLVVHLTTAAAGAEAHYSGHRRSLPKAISLDTKIMLAWKNHRNRRTVSNQGVNSIDEKVARVRGHVLDFLDSQRGFASATDTDSDDDDWEEEVEDEELVEVDDDDGDFDDGDETGYSFDEDDDDDDLDLDDDYDDSGMSSESNVEDEETDLETEVDNEDTDTETDLDAADAPGPTRASARGTRGGGLSIS